MPALSIRRRFLVAALWLLVLGIARAPAAADDVPFLSGRVNDTANLLPPEAEAAISSKLETLEKETGAQVAVLTVQSIGDAPVEDYALKVAEAWKLGRKGIDDGAIFLVAQQEHAVRIEVGYGLEPKLPDVRCKRILEELVVPKFRAGDFPAGIAAGVDAVDKAVRGGDPLPPPKPVPAGDRNLDQVPLVGRIGMGIVFLLFMMPFGFSALRTPGCGGWFVGLVMLPFLTIFPYSFFGMLGLALPALWLIFFPIARLFGLGLHGGGTQPARRLSSRGGWWGGPFGGFGGGGFGGGGFGGGGSFGGGFSGGGGSFGGGGASSSW